MPLVVTSSRYVQAKTTRRNLIPFPSSFPFHAFFSLFLRKILRRNGGINYYINYRSLHSLPPPPSPKQILPNSFLFCRTSLIATCISDQSILPVRIIYPATRLVSLLGHPSLPARPAHRDNHHRSASIKLLEILHLSPASHPLRRARFLLGQRQWSVLHSGSGVEE